MGEATGRTALAVVAIDVEPRKTVSNYPEPFASRMSGREKRVLGNIFGLKTFGMNLTRLAPGAVSSVHHSHSRQDEMIWIVQGQPTLVTDTAETAMRPGMCAGFPAAGPPTISRTAPPPTSSTWRSATAAPATASNIRMTT